jgi:CBS domain-containing protein
LLSGSAVAEDQDMTEMSGPIGPNDLPVSALVGDAVRRIAATATLTEVAATLTEAEIGVVVVGDGAVPTGVVSERDIVRAVAEGRDLDATTASDVAHTELRWVQPDTTVGEVAVEMMDNWVRHVLVGEAGSMVGIVSMRDLIGVYAASDEQL